MQNQRIVRLSSIELIPKVNERTNSQIVVHLVQ